MSRNKPFKELSKRQQRRYLALEMEKDMGELNDQLKNDSSDSEENVQTEDDLTLVVNNIH